MLTLLKSQFTTRLNCLSLVKLFFPLHFESPIIFGLTIIVSSSSVSMDPSYCSSVRLSNLPNFSIVWLSALFIHVFICLFMAKVSEDFSQP